MGREQDQDPDQDRDDASAAAQEEGPPPFGEWVVAAIGLVLVLACLAYLTFHALAGERTPPDPMIEIVSVQPQAGRFLVELRVTNRGQSTAEGLKVAGELKQGGTVVERAETEFQFLPGRSTREGGLFFTRDPRPLQLELRPESYQVP